MSSIKNFLNQALFQTRLSEVMNLFTGQRLMVLGYHRLYEREIEENYPFDKLVFEASGESFYRQMQWYKCNADILDETQFIDIVRGRILPPKKSLYITFDDGYIDNFEIAYPILKSLGITAHFFIPVEMINKENLGWWDTIDYLVQNTKQSKIKMFGESLDIFKIDDVKLKLKRMVKNLPYSDTKNIMDDLSSKLKVALPPIEIQRSHLMNWDNIKEMSSNHMAIGSHSLSHRVLSTLPEFTQEQELRESKSLIENKIGKEVKVIAYPCGGYKHYSRKTMDIAESVGYQAGISFGTGVNIGKNIHPYSVKRIQASNSLISDASYLTYPISIVARW